MMIATSLDSIYKNSDVDLGKKYFYKVAGNYEVTWNACSMATGIYLYKLKSNSFEKVNKMILLK